MTPDCSCPELVDITDWITEGHDYFETEEISDMMPIQEPLLDTEVCFAPLITYIEPIPMEIESPSEAETPPETKPKKKKKKKKKSPKPKEDFDLRSIP